tara:strand:+ start:300 stop:1016 length:717 start_codon:yes stop_codon:yes gene_type:complete
MVSIDTVYQRVLAIINKEQRGYITPLEFNLLANQAQMEIFEQYFYDLDQFKRRPTDDGTMSDTVELIKRKLSSFTSIQDLAGAKIFPENYRTGKVFVRRGAGWVEAKKVDNIDVNNRLFASLFHRQGLIKQPVYCESPLNGEDIHVTAGQAGQNPITTTGDVKVEVIDKPIKVEWGYDVVNERAMYNVARSTDFELHDSEETNLVLKILELSGIIVNKPGLVQIADQEQIKKIQQEKM